MPIFDNRQFLDRPVFINRYVGRKTQTIFAKGDRGQPVFLSGTDRWTGGLGPTTNNEIFGGESTGPTWTDWEQTGRGWIVVGSRQVILVGECHITHTGSGTQSVDGDLTFKAWVKVKGTNSTEIRIGFYNDVNGYAFWRYGDSITSVRPWVQSGADFQMGNFVNLSEDTWYLFGVVITTNTASFYINGVLKQAMTVPNIDDETLSAYLYNDEGAGARDNRLRCRRVFVQYGSS